MNLVAPTRLPLLSCLWCWHRRSRQYPFSRSYFILAFQFLLAIYHTLHFFQSASLKIDKGDLLKARIKERRERTGYRRKQLISSWIVYANMSPLSNKSTKFWLQHEDGESKRLIFDKPLRIERSDFQRREHAYKPPPCQKKESQLSSCFR